MKYLSIFSIKMQTVYLLKTIKVSHFLMVFLLCFASGGMINSFAAINESRYQKVEKNLLEIYPLIFKKHEIGQEIISEIKVTYPDVGKNFYYLIGQNNYHLYLYKTDQIKVIVGFFQESQSVPSVLKKVKGTSTKFGYFKPRDFDSWLLEKVDLLESLLENREFLNRWVPNLPQTNIRKDLFQLRAYLFQIGKPKTHYNLAAVIGEDRFFSGITEEDEELRFMHLPLLHYTSTKNDNYLFYCKISDQQKLKVLINLLKKYYADPIKRELLIKSFRIRKQQGNRNYFDNDTFMADLKIVLDEVSQKYDYSNIQKLFLPSLIDNIQNFLNSNGYSTIEHFRASPDWFKISVAERFLMAKTTAFFRDWREMKFLTNWYSALELRAESENRPIKIKVFGCSTGQEPLSYAFELLERGITNYRILATDIDPSVIAEAKTMRYHRSKFLSLPSDRKKHLLENYFDEDGDFYVVRYKKFLEDRLFYDVQDISQPLGVLDDSHFSPPYDLISVKNVLLYLDKSIVETTVPSLGSIVEKEGILILRDKRYRTSRFLQTSLKSFVGITDFMGIKVSPKSNEQEILKLIPQFSEVTSGSFPYYLYQFAKENGFSLVREKSYELIDDKDNNHLFSLKMRLKVSVLKGLPDEILESFFHLCRIEPFLFLFYFDLIKKEIQKLDPIKNKEYRRVHRFYTQIRRTTGEVDLLRTNDFKSLNDYLGSKDSSLEGVIFLLHALVARDQERYTGLSKSKNNSWTRKALLLMRRQIQIRGDNPVLLEHYARLTEAYYQLLDVKVDKSDLSIMRPLIKKCFKINPEKFSLKGRIALGKLAGLTADYEKNRAAKISLYLDTLKFCKAKDSELDAVLDWWFAAYHLIRANALLQWMIQETDLDKKSRVMQISKAIKHMDAALEAQSVYGHQALKLKDQIDNFYKKINR